jgi:hypothetical protein
MENHMDTNGRFKRDLFEKKHFKVQVFSFT